MLKQIKQLPLNTARYLFRTLGLIGCIVLAMWLFMLAVYFLKLTF